MKRTAKGGVFYATKPPGRRQRGLESNLSCSEAYPDYSRQRKINPNILLKNQALPLISSDTAPATDYFEASKYHAEKEAYPDYFRQREINPNILLKNQALPLILSDTAPATDYFEASKYHAEKEAYPDYFRQREINPNILLKNQALPLILSDTAPATDYFEASKYHAEKEAYPDYFRIRKMNPKILLKNRILPLRLTDGAPALGYSDVSKCHEKEKHHIIHISNEEIIQNILKIHREKLAKDALKTLPEDESCRTFHIHSRNRVNSMGWLVLGFALFSDPALILTVLITALSFFVLLNMVSKIGIMATAILRRSKATRNAKPNPQPPKYTITLLIPLFREGKMVNRLITHLKRMDYCRTKLEIFFLIEDKDIETTQAFQKIHLPSHMHTIFIPAGPIYTKPRALNFGLMLAHGDLIGIYDSEDIPETDQLKKVAAQFEKEDPQVACLQARLSFYKSTTNWISRCFTLEYAAWFHGILPGLSHLNLPVPLGGTSMFIRRDILSKLGGWDAYNVTEDADLGMRLTRNGYQTKIVESTTYEEPNCHFWSWVKQRSRWLKGFALTYYVEMRNPLNCLRKQGVSGFLTIQLIFLMTLISFTTVPVFIILGLNSLGLPILFDLPHLHTGVFIIFLGCEVMNLGVIFCGALKADKQELLPWALTMNFYFIMAFIALCKGMMELFFRPFYWDKTTHGHLLKKANPT